MELIINQSNNYNSNNNNIVVSNNSGSNSPNRKSPKSLLDCCSLYVGQNIPFQLIEERFNRIPEPVQKKVIYHSFPRREEDIYMYSSFTNDSSSQCLPFHKGISIVEHGGLIGNVLQIGFHLTGTVGTVESIPNGDNNNTSSSSSSSTSNSNNNNIKHRVSLSFDRCKITSTSCTCGSREIFWCEHIVALSIYRIRFASSVNLRVPISDQLLQLNREQLQKLVQYIISDHQDVLPTAQNLTDQLLNSNSSINSIPGASDPTAGPSYNERHSWAFDEEQVKEQVRNYLSQGLYYNANKQLCNLFNKVREMLKSRDSNAPRLLNLITYEFITDPRLFTSKSTSTPLSDKHRILWDQLINLWVCICMNPCMTDADRKQNRKLLLKYSNHNNCPTEDCHESEEFEVTSSEANTGGHSSVKRRRKYKLKSVFHRAIECLDTVWGLGKREGIKLKDIPMECARVDALCSHGFNAEAVEVALSVLSHMKQFMVSSSPCMSPPNKDKLSNHELNYGLLGHPFDCHTPVYNTLLNSDNVVQAYEFTLLALGESRRPPATAYAQEKATRLEESIINKLGELQLTEDIKLKLVEICTLLYNSNSGLGGSIYPGIWPMHTFAKYLFVTLQSIDPELGFKVGLRAMRLAFLDDGHDGQGSLFVRRYPRWYILGHVEVQQCNLASTMLNTYKYDHNKLERVMEYCSQHVHSSSHLFRLAQDCLRIGGEGTTITANMSGTASSSSSTVTNHNPGSTSTSSGGPCLSGCSAYATGSSSSWATGGSSSSSGGSSSNNYWNNNSTTWGTNPCSSSSYVNNGGWKNTSGSSSSSGGSSSSSNSGLISVGFKLGLQVLRQTLKQSVHRRRWEMVRWVVNCASEVGLEGVLLILRNWAELFTPAEAVGSVASCIMGGSTPAGSSGTGSETRTLGGIRTRMLPREQEEIAMCARSLAIDCARKDPPSCALNALTLCETEPIAFETAYQIVVDASSTCMNSQQLFTIARYMEHRGYPLRAYKLALLAMENVHIGYNQDTHPAVSDIHWSTSLYYSLPRQSANTQFIQLIIKNVQCANVLSEILRRSVSSNDKSPQLTLLKESTMNAYISTVHSRLTHISPRHYTDFIEFLSKAKESFTLAGDSGQFSSLVESIKCSYKGKKKLVYLVTERFG